MEPQVIAARIRIGGFVQDGGIARVGDVDRCVDAVPAVGQDVGCSRGGALVTVEVFAKGQFGGADVASDVGEATPRLAVVVGLVGLQRFARHVDWDVKVDV